MQDAPQTAMQAGSIDLSVVIVCFSDGKVLLPCLETIYGMRPTCSFEVILVDNGSTDGSIEEAQRLFPEVKVVAPGYNAAYPAGNNHGFEASRGRYVLFLNPDTLMTEGALDNMVAVADGHTEYAAVGPHVLNKDDTLQRSAHPRSTVLGFLADALWLYRVPGLSRLSRVKGYPDSLFEQTTRVDVVSGCCLMVRRERFEEIGRFDTEYYAYFEEDDVCEQLRKRGHGTLYTARATITHLGGATTSRYAPWFRIEFERSRKRYFKKFRSPFSRMGRAVVLFVHSALRILIGVVGIVLTLGRNQGIRNKTAMAFKVIGWQLGIVTQRPRPS